jgi:hypothetical protein
MNSLNLQNTTLPQYTMTLPVSGTTHKFRPFIVKEEKILLLALQAKDLNQINDSMRTVIGACTNGTIDTRKVCTADAEYAFLQIRSKSVGEEVKPEVQCSNCQKKTNIKIKLDTITVSTLDKKKVDPIIKITDTVNIVMRYPSIHDINYNENEIEIAFNIAKSCIESVVIDDKVYEAKDINPKELSDFVDNMLPDQFSKIMDFIQSIPELRYKFKYTCPSCSNVVNVELNSVSDFFR